MKVAEREVAELRRTVDERKRVLESAVANLGRLSSERLTLGGRMALDPWGWLLGACVAGAVLALVAGDAVVIEPVRARSKRRFF